MAALELLEKLEDCGVSVLVDHEELVLRPASKIPPNLLVEVRQQKAEIIQELRPVQGDGSQTVLLARLQAGHVWLLDQHERWQSGDLTAATDAEFSRAWNGWWSLDESLRAENGFEGCIYGNDKSCPEGFPCRGCSDIPAPAVVAQLALT